jgi:hypothetical protein
VLEDFSENDCVELRILKRHVGDIAGHDRPSHAISKQSHSRRGEIHAGHLEIVLLEKLSEGALSCACIENLRSRAPAQKERKKQAFPKLVAGPDELRCRTPDMSCSAHRWIAF